MRYALLLLIGLLALAVLLAVALVAELGTRGRTATAVGPTTFEIVSVSDGSEVPAEGQNFNPSISSDGRFDISQFETIFNTDVASAGFGGMRGIGTGNISLSGIFGTVTKALLYWHGPTNSSNPSANASVTFDGVAITGTNIGFSHDNCWEFANSQGYRAEVTPLVTGNGTHTLTNFLKADADINGASLIVFFDDGDDTNNRDVVLFDGNDSNGPNAFDADGWNVTLGGIDYISGTAIIDLHVGDGQTGIGWRDDDVILNGSVLASGPQIFEGDSVPNGPSATDTNGGLWDIKSFDVTSFLSPGPNTLTMTTGGFEDCLSVVVAAVNLPAGAAPDSDGDGVPDASDSCPAWPNPDQLLPPWSIPADDPDCDGFDTTDENFIGTDPLAACGPNAWPPDHNSDGMISISDVLLIKASFGARGRDDPIYDARRDLNTDEQISISDVLMMKAFFNQECTVVVGAVEPPAQPR